MDIQESKLSSKQYQLSHNQASQALESCCKVSECLSCFQSQFLSQSAAGTPPSLLQCSVMTLTPLISKCNALVFTNNRFLSLSGCGCLRKMTVTLQQGMTHPGQSTVCGHLKGHDFTHRFGSFGSDAHSYFTYLWWLWWHTSWHPMTQRFLSHSYRFSTLVSRRVVVTASTSRGPVCAEKNSGKDSCTMKECIIHICSIHTAVRFLVETECTQ